MAEPSTPQVEQVAVAIETCLSAITAGASYFATPKKVGRVPYFDEAYLQGLKGPVFFIHPTDGEDEVFGEWTTGQFKVTSPFTVTIAVENENPTDNPFKVQENSGRSSGTLINYAIRDVIHALTRDVTLGGVVVNVFGEQGDSARVRRVQFVNGRWLGAQLFLEALSMPTKDAL